MQTAQTLEVYMQATRETPCRALTGELGERIY